MAIYGGATTLAYLIELVDDKLGNYTKSADADALGDGESTVFELPHSNLVEGTVLVTVDESGAIDNTVDLHTGVVTFAIVPEEGAEIHVSYDFIQWTDEVVTAAINEALLEAWAEFHANKTDSTSITPDGTTTTFTLPADCAYVYRVEYKASETDPPTKVRQWVMQETDDYVQQIILYQPESSGTYYLHYIPALVELADVADTMEDKGVPTHAKYGVVWAACASLLAQMLSRRTRTNQFYNVEGPNVPKIYEIQRVISDYRALAELSFKKARRSPRINTT